MSEYSEDRPRRSRKWNVSKTGDMGLVGLARAVCAQEGREKRERHVRGQEQHR